MSGEISIIEQERFLPVLSVTDAVRRRQAIVEFVREVMKSGVDFGVIPGTTKPTLLKPGAEKLCTLFGLTTRFAIITCIEDWAGTNTDGEPFFYYLYRCQLWRDSHLIAEGDGSCNSRETKYRYREAQRICPHCGTAAIVKGRAEYGGGWLCFIKKGGCGAKFTEGDVSIEGQAVGRVPNPDIADTVNTIQKMGQKRALIAATLLAVNASEFFTQDEEERIIDAQFTKPSSETPEHASGDETVRENSSPVSQASDATQHAESASTVIQETDVSRLVLRNNEASGKSLTAAEARQAFEDKAQHQFGYTDRSGMARLAVALLGGRPERWTAQVWQSATNKLEAEWKSALQTLTEKSSVTAQAA